MKSLRALLASRWAQSEVVSRELTFGGVDIGSSGAMAFVDARGKWTVQLVFVETVGRHRLMSIRGNLEFLNTVAAVAGGPQNLVIAYERARKNPRFGYINNYTNGRNEEFWRVLLEVQNYKHRSVDPKTWQSACIKNLKGANTKSRAREYIRQRCPGTEWLDELNQAPRQAITDAMCIALWGKDQYQANAFEPRVPVAEAAD